MTKGYWQARNIMIEERMVENIWLQKSTKPVKQSVVSTVVLCIPRVVMSNRGLSHTHTKILGHSPEIPLKYYMDFSKYVNTRKRSVAMEAFPEKSRIVLSIVF